MWEGRGEESGQICCELNGPGSSPRIVRGKTWGGEEMRCFNKFFLPFLPFFSSSFQRVPTFSKALKRVMRANNPGCWSHFVSKIETSKKEKKKIRFDLYFRFNSKSSKLNFHCWIEKKKIKPPCLNSTHNFFFRLFSTTWPTARNNYCQP